MKRGEQKRLNQIYAACRQMLSHFMVECVSEGCFILENPDNDVMPDLGMTWQELGRFALKDFFRIDFAEFGINDELLKKLDYASIMGLSTRMFIDMLNDEGTLSIPMQPIRAGLSSSDKIAILGIIISVLVAVAGFFVNNKSEPVIINNVIYIQPDNNNYSDVFQSIIDDLLKPTPTPSPRSIRT